MGDGKNEHVLSVQFERHEVRELVEGGFVNRDGIRLRSRPHRIESGRVLEVLENVVDSFDEPIAQARTALLIPQCRATDFGASFRMKIDTHDDRRVQSGFPRVR
jgi:hypothetical protein